MQTRKALPTVQASKLCSTLEVISLFSLEGTCHSLVHGRLLASPSPDTLRLTPKGAVLLSPPGCRGPFVVTLTAAGARAPLTAGCAGAAGCLPEGGCRGGRVRQEPDDHTARPPAEPGVRCGGVRAPHARAGRACGEPAGVCASRGQPRRQLCRQQQLSPVRLPQLPCATWPNACRKGHCTSRCLLGLRNTV